MYSQHDEDERRNTAERLRRKHGLVEWGNVTEAQAALHAAQSDLRKLPSGAPLIIQDNTGVCAYLPGLDGPVSGS